MKVIMRVLFLVFTVRFACVEACAQGAWNIDYIPLRSVGRSLVGREIRIDFKSDTKDNAEGRINIRKMLSHRDTVMLRMADGPVKFVECWKIYADHGVLADQTLESIERAPGGLKTIIQKMIVRSTTQSSLTVEVTMRSVNDVDDGEVLQEITIDKSVIKGVLLSID